MYYEHFGLTQAPFKITPNTGFFFAGGNRGAILDALIYAITHGEGIVKVTGEVGSGKTMLCRMLTERLPDNVETVYLANPSVEPGEILHAIAFELHLDVPRESGRLEVMKMLQDHLLAGHGEGKQFVIFVEEAQSMPIATLEEIRLLSNLETQHNKLLQIVLFGQPELDDNLNQWEIRQLKERITHSFTLSPLGYQDIGQYLMFRLRAAGYTGPDIFTPAAVKLIAKASLGLSRRVNIIADKALLAAYAENRHSITPRQVKAAIEDSDFIDLKPSARWQRWVFAPALLAIGVAAGFGINTLFANTPTHPVTSAKVVSKPPAPPEVSQVSSPGQLDERLAATNEWLGNQPPSNLSIQVMGSNDTGKLKAYLKQISDIIEIQNVYVYRTMAKGKPSYTVLYGTYNNRTDATKAIASLPPVLAAFRPYLRTIQGIRAEIEQYDTP